MSELSKPTERLRHPAWMVVAFGGMLAVGINLAITFGLLRTGVVTSPLIAFFVGTLANQLFHAIYYKLALYQVRQTETRSAIVRVVQYILIALLAVFMLWIALGPLQMRMLPAIFLVMAVLSGLNLLLVRMASLGSQELAMIEYAAMDAEFYNDQTDNEKVNFFRAFFHSLRFDRLKKFVEEYYRPGMRIADLGCGNCMWNSGELPVTGVDVNRSMMEWAKQRKKIVDYRISPDLSNTGLPDKSFDIVIMSETLEHLINLDAVLQEVRRVLKDDGTFLITVPYDYFFSPFFILFNVNCLYQGFVRGSAYHRVRCGHINHFTKHRLAKKLVENNWKVQSINSVKTQWLYASAKKG